MKTNFIRICIAIAGLSVAAGCSLKSVYDVGDRCEQAPEYYVDNGKVVTFGEGLSESFEFALGLGHCPEDYPKCARDRSGAYYCHPACEDSVDEFDEEITRAFCSRSCINTTRDNVNCGARGDCWSDDPKSPHWQGINCGSGEKCQAGQCVMDCPIGTHRDQNDSGCEADSNENCGALGRSCVESQICSQGKCVSSCDAGEIKCQSGKSVTCVNPQSHLKFCGANENCQNYQVCSDDERCISGECVCKDGTQQCESLCCPMVEHASVTCEGNSCGYVCDTGYVNNGKVCCAEVSHGTINEDKSSTCKVSCDEGYELKGNVCVETNCKEGERVCINDNSGIGVMHVCKENEWIVEGKCSNDYSCTFKGTQSICGECQDGYQNCEGSKLSVCQNGMLKTEDCTTSVANALGVCDGANSCGKYECKSWYKDTGTTCIPYSVYCATNDTERCITNTKDGKSGKMQKCIDNVWTDQNDCANNYSCNANGTACGRCNKGTINCLNRIGESSDLITCVDGAEKKQSCTTTVANAWGICKSSKECGGYRCKSGYTDTGSNCVSTDEYCETPGMHRCVLKSGASGMIQECVDNHEWQDIEACEHGRSCNAAGTLCGVCANGATRCSDDSGYEVCNDGAWSERIACVDPNIGYSDCITDKCSVSSCRSGYHLNSDRTACIKDVKDCGSSHTDCTSLDYWQDGICRDGKCVVTTCKKDGSYERVPASDGSTCFKKYYNCREHFPDYVIADEYYSNNKNYYCIEGMACQHISYVYENEPTNCVVGYKDCKNAPPNGIYPDGYEYKKHYVCKTPNYCTEQQPWNALGGSGTDPECFYHPEKYKDHSECEGSGAHLFFDCADYYTNNGNYICLNQCAQNRCENPTNYHDCYAKPVECADGIYCRYKDVSECAVSGIKIDSCFKVFD